MKAIFKYVEWTKLSIKYAIVSSMREMPFYYNFPKRKLAAQVENPPPLEIRKKRHKGHLHGRLENSTLRFSLSLDRP